MSLVSYPDGYNPDGLAPVIYIYDQNLALQYTYQHPQIIDPPQQDFILTDWSISGGINSKAGNCRITIEDHTDNLTDSAGNVVIRPGWHIQILLGKDSEGLESWFFGVINTPQLSRPGHAQQMVTVSAFGYAHTLSSRFITIKHDQERDDATGLLNNADMSACVSELVKLVFDETSLLIPPPDPNLTFNGIDDIDVKLANLDKSNQSQGIVISELANVVNAVYGIDPDLDFYFHSVNRHGGFTITNGNTGNIDPDKLMIIRNKPYDYQDTTVRKAFTGLIGLDLTLQLDAITDPGGNLEYALVNNSNYEDIGLGIPFLGPIADLLLYVKRTGNTDYDKTWQLRSYTQGQDRGPTSGTLERQGTWTHDYLTDLPLNTREWITLNLNVERAPDDTVQRILWIFDVVFVSQDFHMSIVYNNTGANIWRRHFSSDAIDTAPGTPRMRALGTPLQTLLKAQNLAIQRQQQHKEQIQYLSGTPQSETATALFEGLMDQAGQERRIWSMTVSAPNARPPLGKQARVIDTHNNLDTNALLIGYDLAGSRKGKLTAININLELERYL